jgi:2-haloacid dehalogenase
VERWATFDCYGTLVDWNSGIRLRLEELFGTRRADEAPHALPRLEPEIQAAKPGASYRGF